MVMSESITNARYSCGVGGGEATRLLHYEMEQEGLGSRGSGGRFVVGTGRTSVHFPSLAAKRDREDQ